MKYSFKIFLLTLFFIPALTVKAQNVTAQGNVQELKLKNDEPSSDIKAINSDEDNGKQAQNKDKKNAPVKQVKSARPDMSKSRGARPPDIVRPSGSRIPRGVGRPAGAGIRGRG
jgi:hypothetical protein